MDSMAIGSNLFLVLIKVYIPHFCYQGRGVVEFSKLAFVARITR